MTREISLEGVLFPPILAYMIAATIPWAVSKRLLDLAGVYEFVWHAPLFNTALYVIWLAALMAFTFA
jgi:hypothetical protein